MIEEGNRVSLALLFRRECHPHTEAAQNPEKAAGRWGILQSSIVKTGVVWRVRIAEFPAEGGRPVTKSKDM